MKQDDAYRGIVIDQEFDSPDFVKSFEVYNQRKSRTNSWTLFGVVIQSDDIDLKIKDIQSHLLPGPYYVHFYRGDEIIVVFKDKVFYVNQDSSGWKEIMEFGETLNIPSEQLDFVPKSIVEEEAYWTQ